jgi:hypothetical protein
MPVSLMNGLYSVKIQSMVQKLNLPTYDFKIKQENGKQFIFDEYRKRYLLLTPEEWVRQSFARYLINEKGYPASLMMTEQTLHLNKTVKRCDILIHKPAGKPAVLVECKAPGIAISGETFDQIARYNLVFRVKYLIVSNGLKHYCCYVDFESKKVEFMDDIPKFGELD